MKAQWNLVKLHSNCNSDNF